MKIVFVIFTLLSTISIIPPTAHSGMAQSLSLAQILPGTNCEVIPLSGNLEHAKGELMVAVDVIGAGGTKRALTRKFVFQTSEFPKSTEANDSPTMDSEAAQLCKLLARAEQSSQKHTREEIDLLVHQNHLNEWILDALIFYSGKAFVFN